MEINNYIPGQRWVSNTESELGLGLILDVNNNRVTVLYLATGDKRVYAKDNAPLSRALFTPGDMVESTDNTKIKVRELVELDGLITYIGSDESDRECYLKELDLNHHIQLNKPQDRLFTGQIDPSSWFVLRYETWKRQFKYQKSKVKGLLGARASLIEHQLYITHEVADRFEPRIMLSDEVGLGKTIEAGLILQYRLINGLSQRQLIIVPESLLHQWLLEMLRRFNLQFSIFDEQRCLSIEESNPFDTEQLVLCSQDFFSAYPHRQQQALLAGWDIVVVDEAHHLQWSERSPSDDYLFVEQLALTCAGLILLTATPEQLGKKSHFARLRLLDPDRFYTFDQFLREELIFEPVANAANFLLSGREVETKELEILENLLKQDNVKALLDKVNDQVNAENVRNELIRLLLDHHGTGRVLFRNSRKTVQGFPQRNSMAYPLNSTESCKQEDEVYYNWLLVKLAELQKQQKKAILICKRAETVIELEKNLRKQKGIASAVFHEGMSIVERDRAAAYFSDEESTVPLLICSEIGSEGRNFQFVHHLILYDLPENPDLLQQRIGRLDRIGQKNIIQIHIPYILNTTQHFLFRWYEEGFNAFQINSSVASQVAIILKNQFEELLNSQEYKWIDQFMLKTQKIHKKLKIDIHRGRDQLLELNSCRKDLAKELVGQIRNIESNDFLWDYMELVFDCYGVEVEQHSKDCYILRQGAELRMEGFPCLPEDGVTVTTSRERALEREDFQFITQEHPMVMSVMELVQSSEVGNAVLSVVRHPKLSAGQFLLELIFVVECSAPKSLRINRYLPHVPIRILINQNVENISEQISHQEMVETNDRIEKEKIIKFIGSQKNHLLDMIKKAENNASQQMQQIVNESKEEMQFDLGAEIKRLKRLKKINPSIKNEEIEQLKDRVCMSTQKIKKAQLKLDALRFIITT